MRVTCSVSDEASDRRRNACALKSVEVNYLIKRGHESFYLGYLVGSPFIYWCPRPMKSLTWTARANNLYGEPR